MSLILTLQTGECEAHANLIGYSINIGRTFTALVETWNNKEQTAVLKEFNGKGMPWTMVQIWGFKRVCNNKSIERVWGRGKRDKKTKHTNSHELILKGNISLRKKKKKPSRPKSTILHYIHLDIINDWLADSSQIISNIILM